MSRELDYDNLSDEDKQYLLDRGNPGDLRRAGLLDTPDFDLSSTPDSIEPHELTGDPEPAFDLDSKVAEDSVGNPSDPADGVLQPNPGPEAVTEQVPFEPEKPKAPAKSASSVKTSDKA